MLGVPGEGDDSDGFGGFGLRRRLDVYDKSSINIQLAKPSYVY